MVTGHIFGDTGGHANELFTALSELGVDLKTGEIPEDIHILHVGDLVHKGPGTDRIVALVNRVASKNPERWTQIIGNHEAMHIGLSKPFTKCNCSDTTISTLISLRDSNFLKLAASVSGDNFSEIAGKDALITHAGLTNTLWREAGRLSAQGMVDHINMNLNNYLAAGLVPTDVYNEKAGVFWAEALHEVRGSWVKSGDEAPFHQVHGHIPLFKWELGRYYEKMPTDSSILLMEYERACVSRFDEDRTVFITIDPGFSNLPPSINTQPNLTVRNFGIYS